MNKYIENGIIFPFIIRLEKVMLVNFFFSILKKTKSLINIEDLQIKNIFVISILRKILNYKLKKIFMYKRYTSLLYLNNFKFNTNFLLGLKNILFKFASLFKKYSFSLLRVYTVITTLLELCLISGLLTNILLKDNHFCLIFIFRNLFGFKLK